MIGALSHQIRGAAIDALFNGTEKITKAGLKAVPLDVAAGSPHFRGPRSPMTHENVRVLPFQVRPRPGEGIRSFIGRLAHANHLPPRYLRTYLCEPPEHLGLPSWTRLAAATGRAPETLVATRETRRCPECDAEIPPSDVIGRQALRRSQACREKAYRKRHPRAPVQKAPCRECGKSLKIQLGRRYRLCSSAFRRADYRKHEEKW